jgi:hypothetical protein
MADKIFTPWQADEDISAKRLNEIQEIVQIHDHILPPLAEGENQIRWVRLTEWIGPESNFDNRSAVLQIIDTDSNELVDTDPEQTVDIVTDPLLCRAYPKDSIIPCQAHPSGLYLPLSGHATVLFGKPGSNIAAISGVTPDSQTVTVWEFDSDAGDFVVTDPAVTFSGYSILTSVVSSSDITAFLFDGKKSWFASGGGGSSVRIYSTTLTADLASGDTTATVNTTYAGRAGASGITGDGTVDNTYSLAGLSGDKVIVQREGSGYEITQVQHHLCGS